MHSNITTDYLEVIQDKCTYTRTYNDLLSFEGTRLLRDRHLIHSYPAMLHPLLVDYLLNKYSRTNDIVLDPFCGSGVSVLQAARSNLFAVGCDINPLALLISYTKSRKYKKTLLTQDLFQFQTALKNSQEIDIPNIKNIEYWYSSEVIQELGRARAAFRQTNLNYPHFFLTNLAFVAREQSLTRNGEFKRYRVANPYSNQYRCRVIEKLIDRTTENVNKFIESKPPLVEPKLLFHDSQVKFPLNQKVDLVISSPPYGDSGTTVAYGQYSSFGLEWLNDMNPFFVAGVSVDRDGLGKKNVVQDQIMSIKLLSETLLEISRSDEKRANQVLWFFDGYFKALQNVVRSLNVGGRVCLVVGNRTVRKVTIPMDQITADFLTTLGLRVTSITSRRIHNKIMPHANSPSNQKGQNGPTMNREFIVVATLD